jgi:hypothetical protein
VLVRLLNLWKMRTLFMATSMVISSTTRLDEGRGVGQLTDFVVYIRVS